jgi:hypothetical protein
MSRGICGKSISVDCLAEVVIKRAPSLTTVQPTTGILSAPVERIITERDMKRDSQFASEGCQMQI